MTDMVPYMSGFLREHMPRHRNASLHTIASYADSFMLLVLYAAGRRVQVSQCAMRVDCLQGVSVSRLFL